jgi:hypothetical protein
MQTTNTAMASGNPDTSSTTERGLDGAWSLLETLDNYEVEELTPAQATKLLREAATDRKSRRGDH